MIDESSEFKLSGPALNSGAVGLRLAEQILAALRDREIVHVDFANVERMTASFANSLLMPLLEAYGVETVRSRVVLLSAPREVLTEWNKALERYARGVRLSIQRREAS